jgi:hypothetical protein
MSKNTAKKVVEVTQSDLTPYEEAIRKNWDNTKDGMLEVCKNIFQVKNKFGKKKLDELKIPFARQNVNKFVAIGESSLIEKYRNTVPASWGTLYVLSRLDEVSFESAIRSKKIKEDMTRAEAQELVNRMNGVKETTDDQKQSFEGKVKLITIYCDEAEEKNIYSDLMSLDLLMSDDVVIEDIYSRRFENKQKELVEKAKSTAIKTCLDALSARYKAELDKDKKASTTFSDLRQFTLVNKVATVKKYVNPDELLGDMLAEYTDLNYLEVLDKECEKRGVEG